MVQCLKEEIDMTVQLIKGNKRDLTIIPEMKEEMNNLITEIKNLKIKQMETEKSEFESKQKYQNIIMEFENKILKYSEITKKVRKT